MAKRKISTFERLQKGQLNRSERRELGRRLEKADPGLTVVHPDTAGIDVGNESHYVAVPPDRDVEPIREFGSWTQDLHRLVDWLKQCRIGTVVMQATGVYWIPLEKVLREAGLAVSLVEARGTKNVPGRKTDVQECEWVRKLHTYGLLRGSFRPAEEVEAVRTVWRQRERVVRNASAADAEGPDEDERATGECDQRQQRGDRDGDHSRHRGRGARSLAAGKEAGWPDPRQ